MRTEHPEDFYKPAPDRTADYYQELAWNRQEADAWHRETCPGCEECEDDE